MINDNVMLGVCFLFDFLGFELILKGCDVFCNIILEHQISSFYVSVNLYSYVHVRAILCK